MSPLTHSTTCRSHDVTGGFCTCAAGVLARSMGRQKEDLIKFKVTQRVGVDVRKPHWMPEFVWKWMWRQVVITEEPMRFEKEELQDHG